MKKLRNKITGEINEFMVHKRIEDSEDGNPVYAPFDGHIDEWEDYEEPKEYWYIDWNGEVCRSDIHDERTEQMKLIGNYFETKEEAEKVVEKLKCFTNLKNHEFMFDGWYYGTDGNIVILANAHEFNDMEEQDLTKVFGEKIC